MRILSLVFLISFSSAGQAQDWSNFGGNRARNGQSPEIGPQNATSLWSNTDDFGIISWHPFIEGDRVFAIRETGFPQNGGAANDALVAYDLDTGGELWRVTLPFGGDTSQEWIAWIAGVRDGRVYASRASFNQPQPIRAYDSASGALLWTSVLSTETFAYEGVVFAPDGDLLVGDFTSVSRIESTDGSTVWSVARSCPVSGNCGVSATDDAVFIDEPAPNFTNKVTKLDLATGAALYSTPDFPGWTAQNNPFLSPDGNTVYFSRTQNNPTVDFLYAFDDTGTALVQKWAVPVRWTTSHEHGIGPDGSIYTFSTLDELIRIDPDTGATLDSTAPLSPLGSPNVSPKTVVDSQGNVYITNGWANDPPNDGRLFAYNADLSVNLFTLTLNRPNQGGPAMGRDGTMVVADRNGVHAYRDACFLDIVVEGPGGGPPLAAAVNTLIVDCATPGGAVLMAGGKKTTATTPASACGLDWGIKNAIEFSSTANGAGVATQPVFVPGRAAGRDLPVQAIDVTTCTLSPVKLISF